MQVLHSSNFHSEMKSVKGEKREMRKFTLLWSGKTVDAASV